MVSIMIIIIHQQQFIMIIYPGAEHGMRHQLHGYLAGLSILPGSRHHHLCHEYFHCPAMMLMKMTIMVSYHVGMAIMNIVQASGSTVKSSDASFNARNHCR